MVGMSKIVVDIEKCKGCRLCADACPQKIIQQSHDFNKSGYNFVVQTDKDLCTGCSICAVMCPEAAITVYKDEQIVAISL
jgi:2-oxoglutarate ferredoxin oxidoreductase subunit delta